MIALVDAFNQEKALVEAFSVIIRTFVWTFVSSSTPRTWRGWPRCACCCPRGRRRSGRISPSSGSTRNTAASGENIFLKNIFFSSKNRGMVAQHQTEHELFFCSYLYLESTCDTFVHISRLRPHIVPYILCQKFETLWVFGRAWIFTTPPIASSDLSVVTLLIFSISQLDTDLVKQWSLNINFGWVI